MSLWSCDGRPVNGLYELMYADPPWSYRDKNPQGGAEAQYKTMSVEDLCKLPVGHLAAPDSAMFMWATWPTLPDALRVLHEWGFRYVNCAFDWVKVNKIAPTPFVGLGHWTRGNSEPCLLGVRGKPHRVDAAVQQIVCAPVGRHSAKPPEVRDRIIRLMGDRPAIELFARERTPGWDCWGNEVESAVKLETP